MNIARGLLVPYMIWASMLSAREAYAETCPDGSERIAGEECPKAAAPIPKRLQNLCGISLYCSLEKNYGVLVLPTATLGLVQIPIGGREPGKPSYRDGLGTFKPSIGVTPRFWFVEGWFDAHLQLLYGTASATEGVDIKQDDYLWGVSIGGGFIFSVINVDFAILNRRQRSDSENVDTGGAFLINFDITSAGVLLGTAVSQ